jgi:hypothetical protein
MRVFTSCTPRSCVIDFLIYSVDSHYFMHAEIRMPMPIDVCSIDVLLHGKARTHTFHACARTDATREGAAMAARVLIDSSSKHQNNLF